MKKIISYSPKSIITHITPQQEVCMRVNMHHMHYFLWQVNPQQQLPPSKKINSSLNISRACICSLATVKRQAEDARTRRKGNEGD